MEATSIHWHGIELESAFDGVPGWSGTSLSTTPAVEPGQSRPFHAAARERSSITRTLTTIDNLHRGYTEPSWSSSPAKSSIRRGIMSCS